MATVPTLLAILTCDTIIIDAATRKKSLIGLFDQINAQATPTTQRLGFYARLTDAEGEYTFIVRIVQLGKEEKLIAAVRTDPITCKDRLGFLDIALNTPPIPIPEFGRYELQLFSNDVYIGRALVNVVPMEA